LSTTHKKSQGAFAMVIFTLIFFTLLLSPLAHATQIEIKDKNSVVKFFETWPSMWFIFNRHVFGFYESDEKLLYTAVVEDDLNALKKLLDKNVGFNYSDADGNNPLHQAAKEGRVAMLQVMQENNLLYASSQYYFPGLLCFETRGFVDIEKVNKQGNTALHESASNGKQKAVKFFLNSEMITNFNPVNNNGDTPFFLALANAQSASAFELHRHASEEGKLTDLYAHKNGQFNNALHMAAQGNLPDWIDEIIKNKPELINEKNKNGEPPLIVAINNGKNEATRALVAAGADCTFHLPLTGNTPLHQACLMDNVEIATMLLNKDPLLLNRQNNNKERPLHLPKVSDKMRSFLFSHIKTADGNDLRSAVEAGHHDFIDALIKQKKAPVNELFPDGHTPLTIAIRNDDINTVKTLIVNGADIELRVKDAEGISYTPLLFAAKHACAKSFDLLLDIGTNKTAKCSNGKTVAFFLVDNAGKLDDPKLSKLDNLLSACPELLKEDLPNGRSILGYTVRNNYKECFNIIMKHMPPINNHEALVCFAAHSGNMTMLKELVNVGASLHTITPGGSTALHVALRQKHLDVVDYLLRNAPKLIHVTNKKGERPVHVAIHNEYNKKTIIKLFETARADATPIQDDPKKPYLDSILAKNRADLIPVLEEYDVLRDRINPATKETALTYSIKNGLDDCFNALLKAKFEVDSKNAFGNTPLHCAVIHGKAKYIQALKDNKADETIQDGLGQTPFFIAVQEVAAVHEKLVVLRSQWLSDTTSLAATRKQKAAMAQMLINVNTINIKNNAGVAPVHLMMMNDDEEFFELSWKKTNGKIDLNVTDTNGKALFALSLDKKESWFTKSLLDKMPEKEQVKAFHENCYHKNQQFTEFIINKGDKEKLALGLQYKTLNPNQPYSSGIYPIHHVMQSNIPLVMLETLCTYRKDININQLNKNGEIPLFDAVRNKDLDKIKFLTNHPHKNLYATLPSGEGLLHIAAQEPKNGAILKYFIDDLNMRMDMPDQLGNTPFMYAARNNHIENSHIFMQNDADYQVIKNNAGKTVYDIARENKNQSVFILLDNHQAEEHKLKVSINNLYIEALKLKNNNENLAQTLHSLNAVVNSYTPAFIPPPLAYDKISKSDLQKKERDAQEARDKEKVRHAYLTQCYSNVQAHYWQNQPSYAQYAQHMQGSNAEPSAPLTEEELEQQELARQAAEQFGGIYTNLNQTPQPFPQHPPAYPQQSPFPPQPDPSAPPQ
jgi:ankyrin repeat protein